MRPNSYEIDASKALLYTTLVIVKYKRPSSRCGQLVATVGSVWRLIDDSTSRLAIESNDASTDIHANHASHEEFVHNNHTETSRGRPDFRGIRLHLP